MRRHGMRLLRRAIGAVFLWFGVLTRVPGRGLRQEHGAPVLAVWEVFSGLLLLIRPAVRRALFLLALQMPGTFLPFVVLPDVCFSQSPFTSPLDVFALTLEGQYVVLIDAGLVVGGRRSWSSVWSVPLAPGARRRRWRRAARASRPTIRSRGSESSVLPILQAFGSW